MLTARASPMTSGMPSCFSAPSSDSLDSDAASHLSEVITQWECYQFGLRSAVLQLKRCHETMWRMQSRECSCSGGCPLTVGGDLNEQDGSEESSEVPKPFRAFASHGSTAYLGDEQHSPKRPRVTSLADILTT